MEKQRRSLRLIASSSVMLCSQMSRARYRSLATSAAEALLVAKQRGVAMESYIKRMCSYAVRVVGADATAAVKLPSL